LNAGLGNLDGLKKHLLAASLVSETRFDLVIMDIGLGVAGLMEQYCNRSFLRMVGAQDTFTADRASFILSRYPIEAISKVELKTSDMEDFVVQDSSFIQSTSKAAGIVYLPDSPDAGTYWSEVRFTYTGGFFFETAEPDDESYPSAMPAGAKALPADLRMAWLMQCRLVWDFCDKLGLGVVDKPKAQSAISELDWSPMAKRTLDNYRQMQPI
jgi:hypothetical protein